ncbi:MAG: glycosyl hydrolase 108 family protein [Cytophagales bacterium]|nr:glycosyl hydrolase 108 family protein [Cytophagales bacterium]
MANFDIAIVEIFKNEGGYQNHPSDRGNYNSLGENVGTNYGISAKTYEGYINRPPTADDMRNMTISTAKTIYKRSYWDAYKLGSINDQFIASHILDLFVNHSPKAAAEIAQKAIVKTPPFFTKVDGIFGPKTIATINQIASNGKASELNTNIVNERKLYYNSLGNLSFLDGWTNRAHSWGEYANILVPVIPTIAMFFFCHT